MEDCAVGDWRPRKRYCLPSGRKDGNQRVSIPGVAPTGRGHPTQRQTWNWREEDDVVLIPRSAPRYRCGGDRIRRLGVNRCGLDLAVGEKRQSAAVRRPEWQRCPFSSGQRPRILGIESAYIEPGQAGAVRRDECQLTSIGRDLRRIAERLNRVGGREHGEDVECGARLGRRLLDESGNPQPNRDDGRKRGDAPRKACAGA
jgi:hypothetical protein